MKYLWALLLALSSPACLAFESSDTATSNRDNAQTQANLIFTLNIGKFIFLRVGTGAYPTANSTVNTASFALSASIPATAVVPTNGSSTGVSWNGVAPTFSTTDTTVLPVHVRSNAGQVTLRASTTTALTSGANNILMSSIVITSTDTNLPAPAVPDTGTGVSVNVTGTTFANLVTNRTANWTFGYNNPLAAAAGNYTGQITFTASAP